MHHSRFTNSSKGFSFSLDAFIAILILSSALFLFSGFSEHQAISASNSTTIAEDTFSALEKTGYLAETLDTNSVTQASQILREELLSFLPSGFDVQVKVSEYTYFPDECAAQQTFEACFPDSNMISATSGARGNTSTGSGTKFFLKKQAPGDCNISYLQFAQKKDVLPLLSLGEKSNAQAFFGEGDVNVNFDVQVTPSSNIACDENVEIQLTITVPEDVRRPIDLALVLDRSGSMSWNGRVATNDATAVFHDGTNLYVADGPYGVRSINVSNPRIPSLLDRYDPGTIIDVHGAAGSNYVFITDTASTDELIAINKSNPSNLSETDALNFDLVRKLFVSGNYAYVAGEGRSRNDSGLVIVNVSNPSNISATGYLDTSDPQAVFVEGDYAYLADGSSGLRIINVSNKSSPSLSYTYNTPGYARSVFVSGNYAYIADGSSGITVLDVSIPASPVFAGSYNTPGNAYEIIVSGTTAYIADNSSLLILDVSNPASISILNSFSTPYGYQDIAIDNGFAYLPVGSTGLVSIDLSTGPRINNAKTAAKTFVDYNGWTMPPDQMAVVSFNTDATLNESLTSDIPDLESAIDSLVASGGTDIASGIIRATTELTGANANPNAMKFQVVLSDGQSTEGNSAAAASAAAAQGIIIFTIGFGEDADEDELTAIANNAGGEYFSAGDENALLEVFAIIATKVGELANDSNVYVPSIEGASIIDLGGATLVDGNLVFDAGSITVDSPWTATYTINFPCSSEAVCDIEAVTFPGPGTKFNYTDSDGNFHSVDFNASITISFSTRDLGVDIISGSITGSNDVSLDVAVSNIGGLDSDSTSLKFYLDDTNGLLLREFVVPPLCSTETPGCSTSLQNYSSVSIGSEGVIYAVINNENEVRECPLRNIDAVNCYGGPMAQVYAIEYAVWRNQ